MCVVGVEWRGVVYVCIVGERERERVDVEGGGEIV